MKLDLEIDSCNQWFATLGVLRGGIIMPVSFKIDSGCNALILSHDTLRKFGCIINRTELSKLPAVSGAVVSGDMHMFRKLGSVSLFNDAKRSIHICDAQALCHATHETHDLLGTAVFQHFNSIAFKLTGKKYMELIK